MAAGTAYGLEAELSDLEECARAISSTTSDIELSFLEEQVASAAAKVHQSDIQVSSDLKAHLNTSVQHQSSVFFALQVSNISARIAALKNAGLNVDTHATKTRTSPVTVLYPLTYHKYHVSCAVKSESKKLFLQPVALNYSRQQRRRLPAPPTRGQKHIHTV